MQLCVSSRWNDLNRLSLTELLLNRYVRDVYVIEISIRFDWKSFCIYRFVALLKKRNFEIFEFLVKFNRICFDFALNHSIRHFSISSLVQIIMLFLTLALTILISWEKQIENRDDTFVDRHRCSYNVSHVRAAVMKKNKTLRVMNHQTILQHR